MNRFEKAIIDGLKTTIKDYISLKGADFEHEWSKPEYLATLNIAKSITQFNAHPAENFIIAIEENTKLFSNSCVPPEMEDIFNSQFEIFNTERNGKIDIVVYKTFEKKPVCAIEVKNFNPQENVLVLDLKRNAQYFTFQSETGVSVIQKAYVAYFKHFTETRFKNDIQADLDNAKKELYKIIQDNVETNHVQVRVEAETIHDNLLYPGKYSAEEIINDTGDFYAQSVHFIGVLAIFEKKSE